LANLYLTSLHLKSAYWKESAKDHTLIL
jgi:hypothetical protein